MKTREILLLLLLIPFLLKGQQKSDDVQYVRFYYANGTISSEGYMRDGKPDLYWKTYYEDGVLKSEGNRKNFMLDSVWKFYDNKGNLTLEITYKENKKNGQRKTYLENETIVEQFVDDIKQGFTYHFFPNGKIKKEIFYKDGLEDGIAKEYDENGNVITLFQYKKGFLISREIINRKNSLGNKHGIWMYFYEDGTIKRSEEWRNGVLNGFVKEYDENGNLRTIVKYVNGEQILEAEELKQYEIRYDYYEDGKIKIMGSYRNNLPDGVRREYNEAGKIIQGYIFRNGIMIAEGIIDEKGLKQGDFREYFENGQLMAEGKYVDSRKVGKWKFFYQDGALEQEGNYNSKGKQIGEWIWYYNNGNILRRENYLDGKLEGSYEEYDINGKVIVKGNYFDGEETGDWFWEIGDVREEGSFVDGQMSGNWKTIDIETGKILFEGKYLDGYPNGKHIYFWPNGLKRIEGHYIMGQKEGEWYYYDSEGRLIIKVSYRKGIETKYDNTQVLPHIEE